MAPPPNVPWFQLPLCVGFSFCGSETAAAGRPAGERECEEQCLEFSDGCVFL